MSERWDIVVRHGLAVQDHGVLEQVIASVREPAIIALLRAFLQDEVELFQELGATIHDSLRASGRIEESLTVALLQTDMWARLAEHYRELPAQQQARALKVAMDACERAIHISSLLNDQPCLAIYNTCCGRGHIEAGEYADARKNYEISIAIYRRLVVSQPETYKRRLAETLYNMAHILKELHDLELSRQTYEEAIALWYPLRLR